MIGGFFGLMTFPISYDWASLMIRLAAGAALLPYGLKKISDLKKFSPKNQPADIFKVWFFTAREGFIATMLIETVVPICLLAGFLTRLAVIPCIFSMAIAFQVTKGPYLTSPASIYLLLMIALFFIGSGQYSLDYLLMQALCR